MAGMYEAPGDGLCDTGLPCKGAMGTFSPPLEAAGQSVRGSLAERLALDVFASEAAVQR